MDLVSSDDEVGATGVGNSGLGNEADETGDGSELSDVEGNRMDEDQKEGDGSEEDEEQDLAEDDATSDMDMDPEGDEADDESGEEAEEAEEAEEEDSEKENDGDRILSSAAVAELIRFNNEGSYPDILTGNPNSRGEGHSADVAEGTLPGGYEVYADGFGNVTHNGQGIHYSHFGDGYQFTAVSHSGT